MAKKRVRPEKTLDEALDEFEKWGEKVSRAIENLSPEEVVEYFNGAQSRLEKKLGFRLNLRVRRAPKPTRS